MYQPTNRDKKLATKRGFGYCGGCDKALIGNGKKCPICGTRNGRRKLKHNYPHEVS